MRKKYNIVVQKYIEDLAETQKSMDLNDLQEESEEAGGEADGDTYNKMADNTEVQDNDEENDHIKIYEEDENNSLYENEEDEDEDADKIDCVSITLLFIF
jgi:hypothetical protein